MSDSPLIDTSGPKGDIGDTGAQGDQGIQGIQGEPGGVAVDGGSASTVYTPAQIVDGGPA